MKRCVGVMLCMIVGMVWPCGAYAQDLSGSISGMHAVLEQLYDDMLPLCSQLIGVGRGIAGFAATWYIGSRVWRHLSNAEPIDFYPLFRPFVIGFAVLIFPSVLGLINGVMKPTVTATSGMVEGSDKAITTLLKQKEEAIKNTVQWQMYMGADGSGDRDKWYQYQYGDEKEGLLEGIGNDVKFAMAKASYSFRNSVKQWMSEVLELLFQAAALCINTIRTFYLVILAILGPLVFGLAVFDGFQHTLTVWIARYINVFLWLPVANIFGAIIGKVQEKMLELDLAEIGETGDTFFSSTDTAYLIFLLIGIIGYFTVPSVANYIVHAGGGNALLHKVSSMFSSSSQTVVSGGASMTRDVLGDGYSKVAGSMAGNAASRAYFGGGSTSGNSGNSDYMKDKIKGQ